MGPEESVLFSHIMYPKPDESNRYSDSRTHFKIILILFSNLNVDLPFLLIAGILEVKLLVQFVEN